MAEVARLNVLIQAKADQLESELSKASKRLDRFGSRMQGVGLRLTAGVTAPILAIGAATVTAANRAEESENLFEVSMGNMADSARAFSEETADALGRNAFAIRENIGQFNALFTTLGIGERRAADMSQQLTQLTIDLASFFNQSESDVFRRLQSGLAGEAESLRRLNVFVNEATIRQVAYANGIAEAGAELTEAQKVQARYLAILDQTSLAQGDAARTADSATNQTRAFKERIEALRIEIGQKLQPAYVELLKVGNRVVEQVSGLVEAFGSLPRPVQTAVAALTALGVAGGPAIFALGSIARAIAAIGSVASSAIGSAALGGLAAFFVSNAPLIAGVAAAVAGIGLLARALNSSGREAQRAREEIEQFRESLDQPVTIEAVRDLNVAASLAAIELQGLRDAYDRAADPVKRLELRDEIVAAEQELARLQRRADLIERIPIETEATIRTQIEVQERELTGILNEIDRLEREGGTVPVDVQVPNLTPFANRAREAERLSVSAENVVARLEQQADQVAGRINELERELESFRSRNKPIEVEVDSNIDPTLGERIKEIGAQLRADLRSLDTQAQVLDLSPLEVARERVALVRSALVRLADEGLSPNARAIQTMSDRLDRLRTEATELNESLALENVNALIQSGALQAGVTVGAGGGAAVASAVEENMEGALAVGRSFESGFQQLGSSLIRAISGGMKDAQDLLLNTFETILGSLLSFGISSFFGGIFSAEAPQVQGAGFGREFAAVSSSGGLAAVAPTEPAERARITVVNDLSNVTLFADPAAVARTPGYQIAHREATVVARESGFD